MPPALLAAVRAMRARTTSRLLKRVLPATLGFGAGIGIVGLLFSNQVAFWSALMITAISTLMLVVIVIVDRRALAKDIQIGQIKEVSGPAALEVEGSGRRSTYYLSLHDRSRTPISDDLYARLVPLAGPASETSFWRRMTSVSSVHCIDWLTVISLVGSEIIVEVRDQRDRVVYRERALEAVDLGA